MEEKDKTKEQLLTEIDGLRQKSTELGAVEDERMRVEEALGESEEKYRTLFDKSIDAIYITSRDGKFLDANRAALRLFGYTKKEMINNLNILNLYVKSNDRDKFQRKIELKKSVRNYGVKLRKKDGTEMDCLLTATVRLSNDGEVLGYQGIIRDVTEYKRSEDVVRESEARYRAIVEDQTELICRFLPDGTMTFVNEAYCRYFGKKYEELIDHTFMPLIPEEDSAKVREHFDSITPQNPVATHEHRVTAPDGEIRWQQWTNRMLLDGRGRPFEFQAVGRDITEQKLMEEALKDSSEKIKLLAYSISHDLKSPAFGLYGLTKLLQKHCCDIFDDKARNYCDQILNAAEQIAALVENINVYISTKETPLSIERVKLKEILQMVKDEFSPQLTIRRIRLLEPETMPEIKVDKLSILRVMRNFTDNALKYGGEDLSEIRIGYKESDNFHILFVNDDGVGLKEKNSEKIFGAFQRHETSKGVTGSGLGLAIVKEIAERHSGKAWLESGPEKGTTFYLSISNHL